MFTESDVLSVPGDILETMNECSVQLGYNRCYDAKQFSQMMQAEYDRMLDSCKHDKALYKRIKRNTCGSWRGAKIPILPIMIHKHKFGQPCEPHMRVLIWGSPRFCLDLSMDHYELIVEKNTVE
jgi:hypothetical protein